MTDPTTNISISDVHPKNAGDPTGVADPGLLGLLGFVFATITAQFEALTAHNVGPIFWVGVILGGLAQIAAGMQSYRAGDNFHFIVYNAFGAYWLIVPGFLLGNQLGFLSAPPETFGYFRLAFALLALLFLPAGALHNSILPVTLFFVAAGLGAQGFGAILESESLDNIGSVILITAAALAAYMLAEKFYWRTMGRRVLPLGPAWFAGSVNQES